MKKVLGIGFIILAVALAVASAIFVNDEPKQPVMTFRGWENPETKFDVSKNEVNQVHLKWVYVDNVQAACSAENVRRGGKVFKFSIQACSFWQGKECVIMTPRWASIHNLGHETLHCFRGDFH